MKVKKAIKMIAGIFMISTAIWGYFNSLEYIYELTFLSNAAGGVLLLSDGLINLLSKKKAPSFAYQTVLLCTNVVFCTCMLSLLGGHKFNFSGAFFFLHAINPPMLLAIYLTCVELETEDRPDDIKRIFLLPVMIMSYLVFDYVRYIMTGDLVYGLIPKERLTWNSALLIGAGFYLLMVLMSYGLIELKIGVQKKMTRRS